MSISTLQGVTLLETLAERSVRDGVPWSASNSSERETPTDPIIFGLFLLLNTLELRRERC